MLEAPGDSTPPAPLLHPSCTPPEPAPPVPPARWPPSSRAPALGACSRRALSPMWPLCTTASGPVPRAAMLRIPNSRPFTRTPSHAMAFQALHPQLPCPLTTLPVRLPPLRACPANRSHACVTALMPVSLQVPPTCPHCPCGPCCAGPTCPHCPCDPCCAGPAHLHKQRCQDSQEAGPPWEVPRGAVACCCPWHALGRSCFPSQPGEPRAPLHCPEGAPGPRGGCWVAPQR